ncbi:MAG: thiosulfate oxidation carrier complex protein SoxZ [Methylococcales bacterium]
MSSIKIRSKRLDGKTQIRILIAHPMEHGRNRDKTSNELIPAHFIQMLTVTYNQKIMVTGDIGTSISKDPYFAFLRKGGNPGDKITVAWTDNLGNKDYQEHFVS